MPNQEKKKESTFERALRLWGETRLPDLQAQLEDQSVNIQELQTKSIESRKQLASKTKEFRKLDDDEKLKEFKILLKQYQNEIDSLTTRSKLSENGLFQVYKSIGELPDPKPLLEVSLDSVIAAQEVDDLRAKNSALQNDLLKFADYEQLKSRLLRVEQKSNETLNNRLKLKEEELKAGFEEKEQNWLTKEDDYQKRVDDLQKYVKELETQQKIDKLKLRNQRIALGNEEDDEEEEEEGQVLDSAISSKEFETLKKESEGRLQRISKLEKRNEELIRELKVSKSDIVAQDLKLSKELKLSELESENATLIAQLDHQKSQSDSFAKSTSIQITSLRRQIDNLSAEATSLKSKLNGFKDYDQLKQELITLRVVSFGQDDENDSEDESIDDEPVKTSSTQLDEILVSRNKKLTSEIIEFRTQHEEFKDKIQALEQNLSSSIEEINSLRTLNNQLESDLTSLQNKSSRYDNMSTISGITRGTTAPRTSKRLSPASSIAGGQLLDIPENDSSNSVLPIITSQRDRFRSRNIELESQLKKQSIQINELRSEIKNLKKDNSQLFEKTRYLSSFQGSVQRHSFNKDPENLYESTYEESLHPLAKFRAKEQERAAGRLSTLERIFLSFAKAILANKTSRMLFLGYCFGLHCLVMAMSVYVMSLHGSSIPDVGVVDKTTTSIA